jgi:glycosyltransferase involved in cell wall biosynthesis
LIECSFSINGKKLSKAAILIITLTLISNGVTTAYAPVPNILFALYHDFSANSAVHVHNFANELAALGYSAAVAVPEGADRGAGLGEQNYSVHRFDQVDGEWARIFPNGRGPDIIHAWTPRENVRLFCEKIASFCEFLLFVHLEDNEELILEANLGAPFEQLTRSDLDEFPVNLSHPRHYRAFIASANGVTTIMDRLEQFVPPEVPKLVLWPGAADHLFFPRPRDPRLLEQLGIAEGTIVLCYTGNVHSANGRDVRSLYLAAAILDREGTPTRLLRTGRDYCAYLGPDEEWAYRVSIELGLVPYQEIPALLSLADVLVQPGGDNSFNQFRLPGKLPEFFAMGRPVILPRTNLGRFVKHGQDAWVLDKVDALGIVNAVLELQRNDELRDRLGAGAAAFAEKHFNWKNNALELAGFYEKTAAEHSTPYVLSGATS